LSHNWDDTDFYLFKKPVSNIFDTGFFLGFAELKFENMFFFMSPTKGLSKNKNLLNMIWFMHLSI